MIRGPIVLLLLAPFAVTASRPLLAQGEKVPIVAVTGCLTAQDTRWMLTRAIDPVPSVANGPAAGLPVSGPTVGTRQYRLIGVSEFDLPSHTGHTVLVKGLLVKASDETRVNVTSVTMVLATCSRSPTP